MKWVKDLGVNLVEMDGQIIFLKNNILHLHEYYTNIEYPTSLKVVQTCYFC